MGENGDDDRFALDEQGSSLWGLTKSGEGQLRGPICAYPSRRPGSRTGCLRCNSWRRRIIRDRLTDNVGEEIRWISARGVGDHSAIHDRQMSGIFLDVTDRKQAEEGHELLAGEMSHRVKNLLAIAIGPTSRPIDDHS